MKSCTFFGHSYISDKIEDVFTSTLIKLIDADIDVFYVGSHGGFDHIVIKKIRSLKREYPHISYYIVLAYLPGKSDNCALHSENTIYPEGLESVPPKYAIIKRNQWMIENSDYVVTYVNQSFGNAAKFKALSERKGKTVINIADFFEQVK